MSQASSVHSRPDQQDGDFKRKDTIAKHNVHNKPKVKTSKCGSLTKQYK